MKIKELCDQYYLSDSISERENLKDQIEDICREFVNQKKDVIDKVHEILKIKQSNNDVWPDYDYRNKRGSLILLDVEYNDISVEYEDYWHHGGHTKFSFLLKIDEIENFDKKTFGQSLFEELKEKSIKGRINTINNLKISLQNEEQFLSEIYELKYE